MSENKKHYDNVKIYLDSIADNTTSIKSKTKSSEKAIELLTLQENDSIKRKNLLEILEFQMNNQQWDNFNKTYQLLYTEATKAKDLKNIATCYRYKGFYLKKLEVYDSSFYYYIKAEKIYKNLKDNESLGIILLHKSIVQYSVNNFLGADLTAETSYQLLKHTTNYEKTYIALTVLGNISNELKDYNKSLEYQNQALKIIEKYDINDQQNPKSTCLNNIGNTYKLMGNYAEAITYFNLALQDEKVRNDTPDLYVVLNDNLAYCKFKLHNYSQLPNLYFKALQISDSLKMEGNMVYIKNHLSEFYAEQKDTIKALKYAKEALKTARILNSAAALLTSLQQSSNVDVKNSSKYSNEYFIINDSVQLVERKNRDQFAKIQLETDAVIKENDVLAQKNKVIFILLILGTLIFVGFYIRKSLKAKQQETAFKEAQEKANNEITNAIISHQNEINKVRIEGKNLISREIHDGVLGKLFSLRLNFHVINKLNDEQSTNLRLQYIEQLKEVENELRTISHELNKEKFILINNFVTVVEDFLNNQSNNLKKVDYFIDETINWDFLPNTSKIELFRIIQECFQNSNKYAEATQVNVSIINVENEKLKVEIIDNGKGFDVNQKSKGIGINNMIERTKICKGTIIIESKINKGTKTVIEIPFLKPKMK